MANYSKVSQPVLQVDARATVIEAALKGYSKWRAGLGHDGKDDVSEGLRLIPILLTSICSRN